MAKSRELACPSCGAAGWVWVDPDAALDAHCGHCDAEFGVGDLDPARSDPAVLAWLERHPRRKPAGGGGPEPFAPLI